MTLYIIGGICPSFVGFWSIKSDETSYWILKTEVLRFRVNILWYFFIILVPLLLSGLAWIINKSFGNDGGLFLINSIWSIIAILPIMIIGGGLEEIGWRGVLLSKLLNEMSALKATIIVAVIWGLWHLPFWFIVGLPQYGSNFIYFMAGAFSLSFFLSIVYIKTRSVFVCILFHALENAYLSIGLDAWIKNTTGGLIFVVTSLIIPFIVFKCFKVDKVKGQTI
jgi:membrane protease YdiL (CAAX protease family)